MYTSKETGKDNWEIFCLQIVAHFWLQILEYFNTNQVKINIKNVKKRT